MSDKNNEWLGKKVTVLIDRPIGSIHPQYSDTEYEINYGYIPNTKAGDGEPIDAYVLDVDYEIEKFEGVVVAIVEREDDNEFKLVVAKSDEFSEKEIEDSIDFQEKHFKSKIIK